MRWFFLLLPWIELFTLIQLGSRIGAFAALIYVFLTFVVGLSIVRHQGFEILSKLSAAQRGPQVSARLLADDLALGLAGVLLLIPGLVTDMLALVVLLGPARRRLLAALRGENVEGRPSTASRSPRESTTTSTSEPLEGEFRRLDDD